ncbi:metallo-beta-lactamase family protein [Halospina denitrificans]|uniref:Metallo-beta-lactamase family protein n=1 Tax=Halospina denitrificans TaxID=332522 RepID=A0A4R7K1U6_9GAMM|nr:MBL fold metallo-hydrolase [Halospina denitrificans]TDT43479.1 metallo-beta-lactamase family protein [Halospina denitrificans]
MTLNLKHHGAITGVTGSCHELTIGNQGILVDCGLFQGSDSQGRASASELAIEFPIDHIQALVVTHVHIDHVGRIPYLLAAGFEGPILCSEPSARLLPAMLEDALKIGFTRDHELIERVLGLISERTRAIPYNQWQPVFEDGDTALSIRLQRAGHILGSAYVECDARSGNARERIVFSGDLGAPGTPLIPSPEPPQACDRLILESTYGDRDHEHRDDRRHQLRTVIEQALDDGGTVLIPAFSLGRTQELLYELETLFHDNHGEPWRDLEIVVDSPLAANFTDLYRQLKPFWDEEALERVHAGRHPLSFEQLTVIDTHEDHVRAVDYLNDTGRPCVVLAGSGMCDGGRIVNYLKAMLGQPRNDVVFVGYQAEGTPGRDILRYGPRGGWVELDDERYTINAGIHQLSGFSAHAGRSDLLRFVNGIHPAPKEIRLVHGDPPAKEALASQLRDQTSARVTIPSR